MVRKNWYVWKISRVVKRKWREVCFCLCGERECRKVKVRLWNISSVWVICYWKMCVWESVREWEWVVFCKWNGVLWSNEGEDGVVLIISWFIL